MASSGTNVYSPWIQFDNDTLAAFYIQPFYATANVASATSDYFAIGAQSGSGNLKLYPNGLLTSLNNTLDDGLGNVVAAGRFESSNVTGGDDGFGQWNFNSTLNANLADASCGGLMFTINGTEYYTLVTDVTTNGSNAITDLYLGLYASHVGAWAMRWDVWTSAVYTRYSTLDDGSGNASVWNVLGAEASQSSPLANNNFFLAYSKPVLSTNGSKQLVIDSTNAFGGVLTSHNTLDDGSGNSVWSGTATFSAGIQGTGNTGSLKAGVGITAQINSFTAQQNFNGLTTTGNIYMNGNGAANIFSYYGGGAGGEVGGVYFTAYGNLTFIGGSDSNYWSITTTAGTAVFSVYNGTVAGGQKVTTANNILDDGSGDMIVSGYTFEMSSFKDNTNSEVDILLDANSGATGIDQQKYYFFRTGSYTGHDWGLACYDGSNYFSLLQSLYSSKSFWIAPSTGWQVLTLNNTLDDSSGNVHIVGQATVAGTLTVGNSSSGYVAINSTTPLIYYSGGTLTIGPGSATTVMGHGGIRTVVGSGGLLLYDSGSSNATVMAFANTVKTVNNSYTLSVAVVNNTSDGRLKPDFRAYSVSPLDELRTAEFGEYRTISNSDGSRTDLGEWRAGVDARTLPKSIVGTTELGMYTVMSPYYQHWLTGVAKATLSEVDALKAKVAELEHRLTVLERK
jgi:hypothetical protein